MPRLAVQGPALLSQRGHDLEVPLASSLPRSLGCLVMKPAWHSTSDPEGPPRNRSWHSRHVLRAGNT